MRVRPLFFALLLLSITAFGCSKSPQKKLEGKWVGEGIAQVHPAQAGRADEWAKQTKLEFSGSNVTVAIPAEEPRTGNWKLEKADGGTLDVIFKRKAGGEDKSRFVLLEDGKLKWILSNGVEILLKRAE